MIRRYFATLALAGLMGLAMPAFGQDGTAPAEATTAVPSGPVSIAICNPARIFQDMQETQDLRQSMEAEGKAFMEKKSEYENKLRELQSSRDQLKSDSPQYVQRNQELLKVATEFEVWGKVTQADVQRNQKIRMKALFEKIQEAVAKVAEQKQIDLVISEQKPEVPDNIDQVNVDQLRAILNGRNVLYHTPRVDISNDVIAVLDSDYRAGN
jgi:Skp family chaperone for outer membrane proteins